MHTRTPTRGPGPTHAITTSGALQDDRRHPRGTKDEIQDDSNARRLLQCTSYSVRPLYPRDLGENDDFHAPTHVRRPSL